MRLSFQESSCRGSQVVAFRLAVLELWGEFGWREVVGALAPEVRSRLVDRPVSPVGWVPERDMMALGEAVFQGPAATNEDAYRHLVSKMIDHGFGHIRRFVLQLAPPEALLARAPEMWRHDHTHGELTVTYASREATATLRNHDHVTTPLARLTAAEAFRSALARTRASNVTAAHRVEGDALEVVLRWS